MSKQVEGSLFAEYVQMIKKNKHISWNKHLGSSEMEFVDQTIHPSQWYPYEVYQQYGAAIFQEIAGGKPEVAYSWGKETMDRLAGLYKRNLIEKGDPLKSLSKLRALTRNVFNFDSFEMTVHGENHVDIAVDLTFGTEAIQGYSYQMLGSFQRLVELSGVDDVKAEFSAKSWEGDDKTVIELRW
jgi:hypothetical protein